MSRPIRRRAISVFGIVITLVVVAFVAAAIIFPNIVSPRIAAEAPTTRLTIVETAILNTTANASADLEDEITENTLAELASEEASGPKATPTDTAGYLEERISDRLLSEDTTTVRAAKMTQSTLRSQIELYRQQHNGVNPLSTLVDLTLCTNARGVAGQAFQFGPYLPEIPENPITKSATVKSITSDPATTEDLSPGGGGWLYNAKTGNIWLDHPDFLAQ